MKKILMGLAILTAPLSATEWEETHRLALINMGNYINTPSLIPILNADLIDETNTAQDFWGQNNKLQNIFETTDYSFQLVAQHLADFENNNNTGKEWVGQIAHNLFTSLRASLNEMEKLNTFLDMNPIIINEQMARTKAKIKKYQAISREYNSQESALPALLKTFPEEEMEKFKNIIPSKDHQSTLVKSNKQRLTTMIAALIKRELGLPLTESDKMRVL